jgi:hypothetical protein
MCQGIPTLKIPPASKPRSDGSSQKASVATYVQIWIRKLTYSACNSRKKFLAATKFLCLGQWFLRYSSCFFSPQEAQTTSKELFAPTLKRFELKIDLCQVRKITARGYC